MKSVYLKLNETDKTMKCAVYQNLMQRSTFEALMISAILLISVMLFVSSTAFRGGILSSSAHLHHSSRFSRAFATKNIVFLGTPSIAADALRILNERCNQSKEPNEYRIVATVSQPPAKSGRGQKLIASAVQELSNNLGIPVLHPDTPKDPAFLEKLAAMNIDLCITAAYGNYLPKAFLSIPKYGTVNIHPSLLPKYRGASPVQRCLQAGEKETGVSVLYTVPKMDAGPIIKQIKIPLSGSENAGEILSRSFDIGAHALYDLLPSIFDGSVVSVTQDESQATLAAKIESSESALDFETMSAQDIHNRCRGFSEWPGIHCYLHFTFYDKSGKIRTEARRVKFITTRVLTSEVVASKRESITDQKMTSFAKVDGKWVLVLVCSDGSVLGVERLLQEYGKRTVMDANSFFHGLQNALIEKTEIRRLKKGEELGIKLQ